MNIRAALSAGGGSSVGPKEHSGLAGSAGQSGRLVRSPPRPPPRRARSPASPLRSRVQTRGAAVRVHPGRDGGWRGAGWRLLDVRGSRASSLWPPPPPAGRRLLHPRPGRPPRTAAQRGQGRRGRLRGHLQSRPTPQGPQCGPRAVDTRGTRGGTASRCPEAQGGRAPGPQPWPPRPPPGASRASRHLRARPPPRVPAPPAPSLLPGTEQPVSAARVRAGTWPCPQRGASAGWPPMSTPADSALVVTVDV
ncbi:basic proline-rich protein-like [Canis lupus familiaris]|uniref:basic proline-rich protein-like n=1 Tax=Canis lupus familiaris TaxID=9615 RepID=UPI0015F1B07A|nr:basic proline-rich protein-like [Canis lupus familiaris]XP_038544828.1 basic proline-rich protein-like [Canis lupus familiaris]